MHAQDTQATVQLVNATFDRICETLHQHHDHISPLCIDVIVIRNGLCTHVFIHCQQHPRALNRLTDISFVLCINSIKAAVGQ